MIAALPLLVFPQAESVKTGHFEIVTDCTDKEYVKQVADALEAGYAAMTGGWPAAAADKKPYRINLYATLEAYQEQDKKLNGGRFADSGGFSHPDTGEAYVHVQPRPGVPLLDRTRALIRHETFHAMAYRHAVRAGNAPAWLAEGLCERAAEEAERVSDGDPLKTSVKFGDAVARVHSMIELKR